jgi:hypothetical protein
MHRLSALIRNSIAAGALAIKEERFMGLATYRVFGIPGAWRVDHDGKAENTYVTKEAAFEAAVAAASIKRSGHRRRRCDNRRARGTVMSSEPTPEFNRDEVLVCIVLAFCLTAGSVTAIYRVIG